MANTDRMHLVAAALLVLVLLDSCSLLLVHANFGNDTVASWGAQNVVISPDGQNLTLTLNNQTGCRIDSINQFMFGSIEMQIKLVQGNSAGTVTSYYMSSDGTHHDEIDFEFLGNSTGQPYVIHTNVFANGTGNREQQFYPWFDPSSSFHNYTIHWNPSQIVWSIDGTPIRVFRNYENLGVPFPRRQAMKAYSSIWNGEDWATQGGRVKIDWSSAPFVASYTHLGLRACLSSDVQCVSAFPATNLTSDQQTAMANIRSSYMMYDYCKDATRFNGVVPLECSQPQN
ncbi:putative xyloglucan endotransglucosylase/hydrolase protein 26 [Canna indica]|uniref:Xyloglucan endotransglucosylase/hydrolase n=1 Tax=Canna indica TaxID=4628 RepID=A0AAQ3KK57_9LILI|nr:putative xyloglucan endotransglucosylase/hydrolase protein 26 [Canna indica]